MNNSVIRHGLLGLSVLLLPGCASIQFPLQQEKPVEGHDAEERRIASSSEALAQYSMGILESSGGDNKEALRRYEAAVAADPENLALRTELAVSYFHQNRFPEMFGALDEVLRRDPENLRALQLKALGLRIQGKHREALEPLRAAMAIEPAESTHYLEIASVYSRLEETDEALSVLEKSLAKVNDRLSIFQALGELYIGQAATLRATKKNASLPKAPLAVMTSALEEFPEDPYLLTQYGDLLILHRQIEKAIEVFGRIETLNPDDLMIRQKLAMNLAAVGNRTKAIELLEEISAQQTGNTRLLFYLAELYELDEKPDKAIETFQRILKVRPSSGDAYIKQAFLHISLDQIDEALALLKSGQERIPNDMRIVEMLGYAYAATSNHSEAVSCFSKVQESLADSGKKPLMSHFYINFAISRQYLNQGEQAAGLIRTALEQDSDAIDDYMAIILRGPDKTVRLPAALAVLELIQDVIPDTVTTRTLYGLLAFRAEDYETALTQLDRAERLSIEEETEDELTAQFYFWVGASAERVKNYEKSETYFLKAIQVEPDYAEAHNYLAYMLADLGIKLDLAYDHVDVALAIEPDNAAYLDTRGWIYYRRGEYQKALIDIVRALELMPDDPTISDHLGDIHQALGNTAEAVTWWEKALAGDPDNETIQKKLDAAISPKSDIPAITPAE